MTDKEIQEKKKEFIELFCIENEYSNCGYWWKSGEGLEVRLDISSPEKVWQFIEELIKEVEKKEEDEIKRQMLRYKLLEPNN
jgi:hypothetical protein